VGLNWQVPWVPVHRVHGNIHLGAGFYQGA
jgi:hypothetical protein